MRFARSRAELGDEARPRRCTARAGDGNDAPERADPRHIDAWDNGMRRSDPEFAQSAPRFGRDSIGGPRRREPCRDARIRDPVSCEHIPDVIHDRLDRRASRISGRHFDNEALILHANGANDAELDDRYDRDLRIRHTGQRLPRSTDGLDANRARRALNTACLPDDRRYHCKPGYARCKNCISASI